MTGWTRKYRLSFEQHFYDFLGECRVNSRDYGSIVLGDSLYDAQKRFFTSIFDGMEEDIHIFDALKSRQLGISTSSRALSVFWIGMHDGLGGACVFDTDFNQATARREIVTMINDLPKSLRFPGVKSDNRYGLTLENDSTIIFRSAGIRQSKSSGVLGRSVGLSMAHASELCSYENEEGWVAFQNSLSEIHPNRLYIRESTARGPNMWKELWEQDREDIAHVRCVFLGWWSKNSQIIRKTEPDFERYGVQPPTPIEVKKINEVKERYGHVITVEQLAWIRRKMDPLAQSESVEGKSDENIGLKIQEQPWTEDEAFQVTGSIFFPPERLTEQANSHVNTKYKSYMFSAGVEFVDLRVHPSPNSRSTELKVWEEPDADAVYVVASDVAFGSSEKNDRSAIQVLRCYADGLDQVAEYAWPLINTRQLAWVIMAIAGWYAGDTAEVYLIVELNGPGGAVWDEIQSLRGHIASGYQPKQVAESGLQNIFRNVRNYVYMRPDSMSAGKAWHWKTTSGPGPSGKIRLMERLRDFVSNGMLHIRSIGTLEEMKAVTREGDSIQARGSKKDDRVMAFALGVRCWEERVRRMMSTQRRTREAEVLRKRMSVKDQATLYQQNQLQSFFTQKRIQRNREMQIIRRSQWRYGR